MATYIRKNSSAYKEMYQQETQFSLKLLLEMDTKNNLLAMGAHLLHFRLACSSALPVNFTHSSFYGAHLVDFLRFLRNTSRHPSHIHSIAVLSMDANSPAFFLAAMIEKVFAFGLELEKLVYVLKHDRLNGMQSFCGNERLFAEGGGFRFDRDTRAARAANNLYNYKEHKKEVLERINAELRSHPTAV